MLRNFAGDRRGSMSVMVALSFSVLVATAGLIVYLSQLYVLKLREQRTADLALLAAANLSSAISSSAPTEAAIETAQNIADINGFSSATLSVSAVNSGTQLQVTLTKTQAALFSGGLGSSSGTVVTSASTGTPAVSSGACVITVKSEVDILSSGVLSGSQCSVMSYTYLAVVTASLNVAAATVNTTKTTEAAYVTTATSLSPALSSFTFSKATSDPVSGTSAITTLDSKLSTMASGWPYGTTLPVTLSTITASGGSTRTFKSTTGTIAGASSTSKLTVDNSTVTFSGYGAADSSCSYPTTISGTTTISNSSTLIFNSGCYVFQGDVTLNDSTSAVFKIATNASVRFVFKGSIVNSGCGSLTLPAATYSITSGITNTSGGSVTFGTGSKVIGGTVANTAGSLNFGSGPLYFYGIAGTNRSSGTLTFGSGSVYLYGGTLTNYSGTVSFGSGSLYVYAHTLTNTGSSSKMTFTGGGYYLYSSTFALYSSSTTTFGAGNFDLYSSYFYPNATVTITDTSASTSGAARISLVSSSFVQGSGNFTATGVTFALRSSVLSFNGSGTINLTAPTSSSPTYGSQNLLVYSQSNDIYFLNSSSSNVLSGVLYAPANAPYFSYGVFAPSSSGCLAAVAGGFVVNLAASVTVYPCSNYSWSGTASTRAYLKY